MSSAKFLLENLNKINIKGYLEKYMNYIDIFHIIDDNLQNISTLLAILDYKLENYKSENFNTRIDLINSINKENLSIFKIL